ncbi:MAG TPA: hypothetical protein VHE35_23215, partial [Kofleriaceae bacterium]|nr:hypothetical protein [Kofleriaceae bacterium]
MSARRAWWRRAAIALAMLVAIAAGARRVAAEDAGAQAAAIALPIASDRGAIHVRAAAGLDRPARWVAD